MKTNSLILCVMLLTIPLAAISKAEGSVPLELTPMANHHVVELNSNQPYVAGYHVNTEDLSTLETVNATAVTVSFPSTDTSFFPSGSWLGGGMFVQGEDIRFVNVDYGFYMMLVLDAFGSLFVDLGLHQTREVTAPLQMPTEEIIYTYTWRVSGIDLTTPVTLLASWDGDGFVHYSISASGSNVTLTSVNVASLPNCENIIQRFFAGNVINEPFPFSRYVNYFQFGVVSSESIADDHWTVDLREPKMLRKTGWVLVEKAWSTQGDISYLDADWKWGGAPYYGVDAQYYQNPLENPYEVIFSYNGRSLTPGKVLWDYAGSNFNGTTATSLPYSGQTFGMGLTCCFSTEAVILIWVVLVEIRLRELRKQAERCVLQNSTM